MSDNSNTKDPIFADGFKFTPHFILGTMSIKADEAVEFINKNKNDKGWINIECKVSKQGNPYMVLKEPKEQDTPQVAQVEGDNLPF
jgi:hypothetical protein